MKLTGDTKFWRSYIQREGTQYITYHPDIEIYDYGDAGMGFSFLGNSYGPWKDILECFSNMLAVNAAFISAVGPSKYALLGGSKS